MNSMHEAHRSDIRNEKSGQAIRADRMLNRMTDRVVLREHGLTIGIIDIPGAGRRVATWDGREGRNMSSAAAKRFAAELIASDHSLGLKPVHDALMAMVDKLDGEAA